MDFLTNWLATQSLAQWLSVFAVAVVGYFAYRIEKEQFELKKEPHLFLEIVEVQKENPRYDPQNRKWEILIKNASISRYVRLSEYTFSGKPTQKLGKGALIPSSGNGFYPIPISEKDVKDVIETDNSCVFLYIKFLRWDNKKYHARYALRYNKDMAYWYWHKVDIEKQQDSSHIHN
jgi:hypothetical protein